MFESKLLKLVRKLPRAHIILLLEINKAYQDHYRSAAATELWLNEHQLVNMYNKKASRLMLDKITLAEITDIV